MNNLKFTPQLATKLLELKLIRKQVHPTLPLTIWNYTERAQYDKAWDEYPILLHLRGLITENSSYDIIARPFKKFFNFEENRHVPTSGYEIYAKMDGSLGIIFNYAGKWHCATRGSFTSEQAIKCTELMQPYLLDFDEDCTYLVEILYKNNRIVVDYPFEDIILIGVIHKNGMEYHPNTVMSHSLIRKCPIIGTQKAYYGPKVSFADLKAQIPDNEEGYIIKFMNGDRCKIKGENYLRLHRLMTNITSYSIWENLINGVDILELLNAVPDEMFEDIRRFVDNIKEKQTDIYNICYDDLTAVLLSHVNANPDNRKKLIALDIQKFKYSKYMFKLLKDESVDHIDTKSLILKNLKPEFRKF
jgi:RNA ligase